MEEDVLIDYKLSLSYFNHANFYRGFCSCALYCNLGSKRDDSDVVTMETKQTKQKARSTKQDDPYKVYEHLHLSLEEVCTKRHFSFRFCRLCGIN